MTRAFSSAVASVLVSIAALAGCGARPFAEGGSRDLVIVTSLPADAPEVLLLRAIVQRPAIRIENEAAYAVRTAEPSDPRVYRARSLLFLGYGPREAMPKPLEPLAALLETGSTPFVFAPDVWLRGQAVGLVWTERREELMAALESRQNRLFDALDRATFATVRARLLVLPRDGDAERRLHEETGLTLRIPRGYELRVDRASHAALLIQEGPPTRMLRVAPAPDSASPDLVAARDALARAFRPDERTLRESDPTLTSAELRGALRRMHGRWTDDAVSAAGPYRFYEVSLGPRRYWVDLAVFAPGRPKLPYLRELQALAETLSSR